MASASCRRSPATHRALAPCCRRPTMTDRSLQATDADRDASRDPRRSACRRHRARRAARRPPLVKGHPRPEAERDDDRPRASERLLMSAPSRRPVACAVAATGTSDPARAAERIMNSRTAASRPSPRRPGVTCSDPGPAGRGSSWAGGICGELRRDGSPAPGAKSCLLPMGCVARRQNPCRLQGNGMHGGA